MMYVPAGGIGPEGPTGYTYAAVLVRLDGAPCDRDEVLGVLAGIRFSGWLAEPADGWLAAVARAGDGTVAAGRRGVVGVAEELAARCATTVLVVRVVSDRQLLLAAWVDGEEVGRYVSDPSHGPEADPDTLSHPLGLEYAEEFAAASGHPEAADDLSDLLAEELDPDSVIESERLAGVLRLLALPHWLVGAGSLPRDIPTGPRAREMTRLGAGRPGLAGRIVGALVDRVRRRRRPPPAVVDAPRGASGLDPWLM